MVLRVQNTATRQLEVFTPRSSGQVAMFVCGPTVYDLAHAGHAKTYTQFDFIARYLARRYDVTYLLNITDVDDKIIRRAAEAEVSALALARKFEALFWEDMAWLGNTAVTRVARATDYIDAVVSQVKRLADKGIAYELADGWYFDIAKAKRYGVLSPAIFDDPTASRVVTKDKHNAGDFALWKFYKEGEPSWHSVFGDGRPGWHIEDTAITESVFGPQYDLHGGAIDLIFPHHEAEIAQMESISDLVPMVNYWVHTGLLMVQNDEGSEEKMSKSLHNFVTIAELKGRVDALSLRFIFLSQHYSSSLELTNKRFEEAAKARARVETYFQHLGAGVDHTAEVESLREDFFAAIDNDFNNADAFAVLFEFIRQANRAEVDYGEPMVELLLEINELFNVFDFSKVVGLDVEIVKLVQERNTMRREKNFTAADKLRRLLLERGVVLEDKPTGTNVLVDNKLVDFITD